MDATRRGPTRSCNSPPIIVPTPRKKIASVKASVTWVRVQSYSFMKGRMKTLQPYTAPRHSCMKMAAITMNHRLGRAVPLAALIDLSDIVYLLCQTTRGSCRSRHTSTSLSVPNASRGQLLTPLHGRGGIRFGADGLCFDRPGRLQADDDRLRRRRVAPLRGGVQRNQFVGFREVRRRAPPGGRIGDDPELLQDAIHVVPELTVHVDRLAVGKAQVGKVVGVHEDDLTALLDAAIAVIEAVDRGVELVVGPHALEEQTPGRAVDVLQLVDREHGLAGRRRERAGVTRPVREDETTLLADQLVVVRTALDDVRDVLPD